MDSYNKTVWVNGANPPINAENLNHIENGIETVTNAAINTDREIAAARGSYTDLKERLDHTGAPTDEQVAEAVSDYFDEHPISGAEKFVEVTDASDTAVDNCTDPDTVYIVRVVSGVVTTTKMRVICTPNVAGQMAQYAMTKDGYIISRKFTASEWGAWDFIPDSKRVAAMISAAIAGKADSSSIPTKTSQLNNDSGFLTQHQDISGKADKSTTLAGYGITDAYTKSEVDALVSGGVIPQYVIDESESVLAKAFAHKGLGRTIRFIAVSDSHNDATKVSHDYTRVSNLHCGQAVKYIADRIPLDFVASLGDMTWAGVAHTTAQYQTDWLKADIQEMNMFLKDGFSGVPNIRVVGNHDQCATTDSGGTVSRLQNSGAYQYFGRYNAGANDGLSNYGYYDIDNVKLRIIYLNTSDTVSTSTQGTLLNVSQEQKNWLCETLIDVNSKSDAADWKILLLSHAPLDMVSGIAADILIPYTNGGTYGSYTFTNHNAKIIGNCHGHTHCYRVDYMADKIRRFTIPNSNFYDNNHYKNNANYSAWNEDTTYPKTENSRTDTSFSLVTVDLDSLTCYVDNYGAGYDREFSLDYKSAPAPVNLFDKNDSDVVLRARFNSSHVPVAYADGQLVTGFIPVSNSDTITIAGDKSQNTNSYVGYVNLYNSNKEYIGAYAGPGLNGQKIVWSSDYLEGSLDCSQAPDAGTNSGAAYIRLCLAYTDIDAIEIYKQ